MAVRIFQDIPYFYKHEIACPCCGALPPDLHTHPMYHDFFFKMGVIRRNWGKPVKINEGGGYRCPRYQFKLITLGKTEATVSPHSFCAVDADQDGADETMKFVELVDSLFPELRIGYKTYIARGQSFAHLDNCYLVSPRPSPFWVKGYRF